jgi:hypothetical protein
LQNVILFFQIDNEAEFGGFTVGMFQNAPKCKLGFALLKILRRTLLTLSPLASEKIHSAEQRKWVKTPLKSTSERGKALSQFFPITGLYSPFF